MSYYNNSHTFASSSKRDDATLLGYGNDRLMSWCPSMNIYRVNRFNILTNDKPRSKFASKWVSEDGGVRQTSFNKAYTVTYSNYNFNLNQVLFEIVAISYPIMTMLKLIKWNNHWTDCIPYV